MITLIHGPAELTRAEALQKIVAAADSELADLNTARLDGRTVTLGELHNICDTLPFLADCRIVIVEGLLARLTAAPGKARGKTGEAAPADDESEAAPQGESGKALAKGFFAYLEELPETTHLVLLEEDSASGAALRRCQELSRTGKMQIITCEKPRKTDLPAWISERAQLHRLKLDGAAIADLADFVGDELRQLDQELIKLADYAGGRLVGREDVRRLVPATRAANVFDMIDALGAGNGAQAARLLRHALDVDGDQPLRLIGLIAWHYRQIIQVKALLARGARAQEIAHAVNVGEWKVPRLTNQANRVSFARLQAAMERILAADEAIKTGRLTDREAMDVLLAELL